MKKTISILVTLILCITLSSCKRINEPRIKGDLASKEDVNAYIENYENVTSNNYDVYDQWYKINLKSEIEYYEEEEHIDIKANINLDGKIFQSQYDFKNKGKFTYTVDMKGTIPATKKGTDVAKIKMSFKMDFTIIENITYVKLNVNAKVDRNIVKFNVKTTLNNLENELDNALSLLGGSLEYGDDIFDDILGTDALSSIFQFFDTKYIISDLKNSNNGSKEIYAKKDKFYIYDGYSNEEETEIEVKIFELDEYNYQLKSYIEYVLESYEEDGYKAKMESSYNIEKCLTGLVKEPFDEHKYI